MEIVHDPGDPTPPYEQVRRQLADLIAHGRLRAGDRLPPLRQLAGDLGLAVGTVNRAYRELEAEGLLVSRRGGGTRVADDVGNLRPQADLSALDDLTRGFLTRTASLGYSPAQVRAAIARLLSG